MGAGALSAQVEDKAENWTSYNRTIDGIRFSPLTQITPENVANMKEVAAFDLGSDVNSFQTGILAIDGKLYFSTDTATYAINGKTGKLIWKATRKGGGSGYGANRGLAYLNGRLFRGTSDGHVLAYNMKNGKLIWDVIPQGATDPGKYFGMCPVAYDGKVFIGNGGGDNAGVIGSVYALDASNGRMLWRFNTVPDAKENPKTSTGLPVSGGGVWTTMSIDKENGLLYASVGNPSPDFDVEFRGADRPYFNNVIALDINTGKVKGNQQVVKNDAHDWDASAAPIIFTTKDNRKLVAEAGKNGLLTVMDGSKIATTEDPAEALPFVYEVPTTTRINTDVRLSREIYTYFKPGYMGGNEWNGPAFDPTKNLLFNGTDDWGVKMKLPSLEEAKKNIPAVGKEWFGASDMIWDKADQAKGWLKAFNAADGSVKWSYHATSPIVSGVTPTASGLLFTAAQNGDVYAFDSETGKLLWKGSTGLMNAGGVITYAIKGKQYVAVTAGLKSSLWTGVGASAKCKIVIYSL
ncbi:PQQ-binding-like beta-propeller repeat protein [Prevotella cerevisiae]|uniref:PQQ-binding-like beta-propeller repeat protein n=1 Tax=Segatella cerevisiae TaxID=2053716 RepID=A0ABT1BWZ1_9BACT|nr:PQQ-binding-like beta-propeller repeat protein [Segatella cerevisiae]MCO6025489.1 PQQ-binding-like beta-propeller repeat protein [Segatella cerevisiae]